MTPSPPRADPYLPGRAPAQLHVAHYDLDLRYRVATNRLMGRAVLTVLPLVALDEVVLDLHGLRVRSVEVAGGVLSRYAHRQGRLRIRLAETVVAGRPLTVSVEYVGAPTPVPSPWGPLGWEELHDGVLVANQPTGAPSWFPCHDRPGDLATYRTSVTVEKPYRALAHGELVDIRQGAGATTWVYEERHPTSTYLATVHIGRYEERVVADGPVAQRLVTTSRLMSGAGRLLGRHRGLMDHHVGVFGDYPYGTYTVVVTDDPLDIPLEAQGISVFGANHLGGDEAGERLLAHELAHQWFGNSVAVSSWQHIWLNEGPACYAEWLWSEASGGPTTAALARRWHAHLRTQPQDLVLSDPGYPRIFDERVYKRGALTLHALGAVLGRADLASMLRAWTRRHAGSAVTTDDFRAHAVHRAGADRADATRAVLVAWLDRPELPPLTG